MARLGSGLSGLLSELRDAARGGAEDKPRLELTETFEEGDICPDCNEHAQSRRDGFLRCYCWTLSRELPQAEAEALGWQPPLGQRRSDGTLPVPEPDSSEVERLGKVVDAIMSLHIERGKADDGRDVWFFVDTRDAEPEVNYPGKLIAEIDGSCDFSAERRKAQILLAQLALGIPLNRE